jgi:ABC-2 type transport system permease protein
MNRALWRKNAREALWLAVACAVYAFGFSLVRVFVVSEFDTNRFRNLLELIPDTFKTFTPVDFEWLISYTGRIAFNLDEPMLIGCLALWAIARGSDVVSGELSRGTMEMLLAQPVSRRAVFATQSLVTLGGLLLIVAATWLGMWVGVEFSTVTETPLKTPFQTLTEPVWSPLRDSYGFVFDAVGLSRPGEPSSRTIQLRDQVNCWTFWPGMLNMFCFGFFLCALTAMFSALDRHRWRTIGLVTGIYTVMAMFKFVGMSLKNAGAFLWFTFFTLYEPEQAIELFQKNPRALWTWIARSQHGEFASLGPMANNLLLIALGIGFYAVGSRVFVRRDLPAPL